MTDWMKYEETDDQRSEKGRQIFQVLLAAMIEQKVLRAYKEWVAQERRIELVAALKRRSKHQQFEACSKSMQVREKTSYIVCIDKDLCA